MTAFFAGVLFGAIFMGSIVVAYFTHRWRPRQRQREIEPWSDDTYQAPPVQTRILVNKREITL